MNQTAAAASTTTTRGTKPKPTGRSGPATVVPMTNLTMKPIAQTKSKSSTSSTTASSTAITTVMRRIKVSKTSPPPPPPPAPSSSTTAKTATAKTTTPWTSRKAATAPGPRILRSMQIGAIIISVVQADISQLSVDAVVNAANPFSFTEGDGGVSGALLQACAPTPRKDLCGVHKIYWTPDGEQQSNIQLPRTQAGVQPAAGGLKARGVKYIIHAASPNWSSYPMDEAAFGIMCPKIRLTATRALQAAVKISQLNPAMTVTSIALPALSGGLFTHSKDATFRLREQRAARRAVIEACVTWATNINQQQQASDSATTSLATDSSSASSTSASSTTSSPTCPVASILLCDLGARRGGAVDVFVEEFDDVNKQRTASQGQTQVDNSSGTGDISVPQATAASPSSVSIAGD